MPDNISLTDAEKIELKNLLNSADTQLRNILFQMGGVETEQLFRPVRCTSNDIKDIPSQNGFVYFTTDTKKIYCGVADGKYLMMGGNSGIAYGTRELTDDEKFGDQVFSVLLKTKLVGLLL